MGLAATRRPERRLGREDLLHLVTQWAERVDWRVTRTVVWCGDPDLEPWTVWRAWAPK